MSKNKNNKSNFMKDYFWQVTSFFLLILLVVAGIFLFSGNKTTFGDVNKPLEVTSCEKSIGEDTGNFIVKLFNVPSMKFKESAVEDNLCLLKYDIEDQDIEIYTSLNGDLIFIPGLEPIKRSEVELELEKSNTTQQTQVVKTDKPVVELFIMSHCPYGTQIEKGILPVVDVLEDKIDFKIKFVNYIMHDLVEIQEQMLQFCIQEEYNDKFTEYLYCFLEEGNSQKCVEQMNFSKEKLDACIDGVDKEYNIMEMYNDKSTWNNGYYPKFLVHDAENKIYDVKGSPTLVVNGVSVNSNRDSQSLLNTICEAFNEKPRACNQELSNKSPTPGFGFSENEGPNTSAVCN